MQKPLRFFPGLITTKESPAYPERPKNALDLAEESLRHQNDCLKRHGVQNAQPPRTMGRLTSLYMEQLELWHYMDAGSDAARGFKIDEIWASAVSWTRGDASWSDGEEGTDIDFVAVKLVEHLLIDFHGCSEEQHDEARGIHYRDAGNNHHDLSATTVTHSFPNVLQSDRRPCYGFRGLTMVIAVPYT